MACPDESLQLISFRPVLFILGLLVAAMGLAMIVPALADIAAGHGDWIVFVASGACSLGLGGLFIFTTIGEPIELSLRQGFLLTTLSWIGLSAVGALPLVFSELDLSYTDAFFEAISGLTTTGSTVLAGLDRMPPGILLWRAMLQWLGGIGIIVMGIAMLPYLRVGGMQLFRMESSDRSEKALPRAAQLAGATSTAYLVLSVACAAAYWAAGMSGFEAIAHAMTTVSTGGYSTSDASLGHFASPAIHWICTLFMILGALPFVIYIRAVRGKTDALWKDSQVRHFLTGLGLAILAMALWLWMERDERIADALLLAAFNVVSVVTTTGFATADYGQWGALAVGGFFFLTFMGGCAGSTSGGIKVMRFEIAAIVIRRQLKRLILPHGVFPMMYRGQTLSSDVIRSVLNLVFVFIAVFVVFATCLSLLGLDFITATSGAATALANVGPGLGDVIGPAGNFSTLPDAAKWILSAGMLLGRLEFFTVLVLLVPEFWRG
jgi:trk system potassium uptake protein TrkH